MAGGRVGRTDTTAVTAGAGRLGPVMQSGGAGNVRRRYLHWLGRREDWVRGFVRSAGLVLLVTYLAKVWTSLEPSRAMEVADAVFGVPFRWLMLGVGWLEVLVAAVCSVAGGYRGRSGGGLAGGKPGIVSGRIVVDGLEGTLWVFGTFGGRSGDLAGDWGSGDEGCLGVFAGGSGRWMVGPESATDRVAGAAAGTCPSGSDGGCRLSCARRR